MIFALFATLHAFAKVKLLEGSPIEIQGHKTLPVYLNCKNAVYEKVDNIEDFLLKAHRSPNWEKGSIRHFVFSANKVLIDFNTSFTDGDTSSCRPTRVELIIKEIDDDGEIYGDILIYKDGEKVAQYFMDSSEHDDDDEITFQDQMDDIGESFGESLKKFFKKAANQ